VHIYQVIGNTIYVKCREATLSRVDLPLIFYDYTDRQADDMQGLVSECAPRVVRHTHRDLNNTDRGVVQVERIAAPV
jgi:hypothetical protein